MKKLFLIICLLASVVLLARDIPEKLPDRSRDPEAFKAALAKLYGRVRKTNSIADFTVRVVNSMADLRVEVGPIPVRAGEWEFVDSCEDFTIRFVDSCEDFTIQFVDVFPGVN